MTIKGFKVGQHVVIIGNGGANRAYHESRVDAVVTKVGRKYVSVAPANGSYESKYRECDDTTQRYLIEQTEYGSPRLLFPSAHAADLYAEREDLKFWLVKEAGWGSVHKYTLEQLREVRRILESERPVNGPLSLDDLECMVGEQVWVESTGDRKHGAYRIVESVDIAHQVLCLEKGFPCYNYGELGHWQAYRNKPEEVSE